MRRIVVVFLGLVLGGVPVRAADQPAFQLDPKPVQGVAGKMVTLRGTAKPVPDQFFLEAAGVLQPVIITLIPQHKGDVLKLVLGKQRWDETIKEASTSPANPGLGEVSLKVRSQGEIRMSVTAAQPTKYWLVVWVGDEVKPELANVVGAKGAGAAASSSSAVNGLIALAVVAVIVVALVTFLRRRGAR